MSVDAIITALEAAIDARMTASPDTSYVAQLHDKGIAAIAQKIGEEGVELALALMGDEHEPIASEAADLMFHMLIALRSCGLSFANIAEILSQRMGVSGLEEKASREC